jgi:hypothetical protein
MTMIMGLFVVISSRSIFSFTKNAIETIERVTQSFFCRRTVSERWQTHTGELDCSGTRRKGERNGKIAMAIIISSGFSPFSPKERL